MRSFARPFQFNILPNVCPGCDNKIFMQIYMAIKINKINMVR